jgi:hypothetical protein
MIAMLSVASERLVEVIKGAIPLLATQHPDPVIEGRRRTVLQILSIAAGTLTAFLAKSLGTTMPFTADTIWEYLAIGVLVSGGSGFWNGILSYVGNVKDAKKAQAKALDTIAGQPPANVTLSS